MNLAFPPGAPSFQLPRPHMGVVYLEAGWVVVKLDGHLPVRVFDLAQTPAPLNLPATDTGD